MSASLSNCRTPLTFVTSMTNSAGVNSWQLRVVGWSFPEPVVATSPLASGPPPRDERPNIGLLHCDRDQTGSRHAPVRSADLAAAPVDAWLLGHIHRPDRLDERPVGYLGSLMGLDPSESGPHGPWLLEIGLDRRVSMRQLPLAPLRWESLAVPVDHVPAPEAVHGEIMRALEELHRQIMGQTHRPQAVGCRIRLIGRTAYRREIAAELDTSDPTELVMERDGVTYFVEQWTLAAQPALDLEELARSSDPAGLLARKLLLLQGDPEDPARRALLAEAGNRLAEVSARLSFASLRDEVLDEQQVAAFLEVSALKALDALLAQREASS